MIGTPQHEIALTNCFQVLIKENLKEAEVRDKAVIAAWSLADVVFERDYCCSTLPAWPRVLLT